MVIERILFNMGARPALFNTTTTGVAQLSVAHVHTQGNP
jgi:hypothetical protein